MARKPGQDRAYGGQGRHVECHTRRAASGDSHDIRARRLTWVAGPVGVSQCRLPPLGADCGASRHASDLFIMLVVNRFKVKIMLLDFHDDGCAFVGIDIQ